MELGTTPTRYIDTAAGLEELCSALAGQSWVALDTEFMREDTYYPRLCLLQLAAPGIVACVDPLALPRLDPLLDILYDRAVTKVLHACHQDMEIFHLLRANFRRRYSTPRSQRPCSAIRSRSAMRAWWRRSWACSWQRHIPARTGAGAR